MRSCTRHSDRPNLEVISRAMAQRIIFEGERAVGVLVLRDDELVEIRAEREVIVSAGAYQSPVLLMLSGIGPPGHLAEMGIETRVELPVGENLQDHVMAQLNYLTDEPTLFGTLTPENFELLAAGRGPLTSNFPEGAAFVRTRPGLDAPDVQFHLCPSLFFDEGLTVPSDSGFCFGPVVIKPTGRGRVRLRTPRPDSKPVVLCNFLVTDEDRASMLDGTRMALEIAKHASARGGDPRAVQRARVGLRRGHHGAGRGARASPCTTRPRRARSGPSSTRSCACTAPRGCASPTHP